MTTAAPIDVESNEAAVLIDYENIRLSWERHFNVLFCYHDICWLCEAAAQRLGHTVGRVVVFMSNPSDCAAICNGERLAEINRTYTILKEDQERPRLAAPIPTAAAAATPVRRPPGSALPKQSRASPSTSHSKSPIILASTSTSGQESSTAKNRHYEVSDDDDAASVSSLSSLPSLCSNLDDDLGMGDSRPSDCGGLLSAPAGLAPTSPLVPFPPRSHQQAPSLSTSSSVASSSSRTAPHDIVDLSSSDDEGSASGEEAVIVSSTLPTSKSASAKRFPFCNNGGRAGPPPGKRRRGADVPALEIAPVRLGVDPCPGAEVAVRTYGYKRRKNDLVQRCCDVEIGTEVTKLCFMPRFSAILLFSADSDFEETARQCAVTEDLGGVMKFAKPVHIWGFSQSFEGRTRRMAEVQLRQRQQPRNRNTLAELKQYYGRGVTNSSIRQTNLWMIDREFPFLEHFLEPRKHLRATPNSVIVPSMTNTNKLAPIPSSIANNYVSLPVVPSGILPAVTSTTTMAAAATSKALLPTPPAPLINVPPPSVPPWALNPHHHHHQNYHHLQAHHHQPQQQQQPIR